MELLQLRYFLTVGKTLNISQAAREHMIPQPSMSATISRLEKELGAKLFDRSKNHLSLTPAGESFFQAVQSSLFTLDKGMEKLKSTSGEVEGELTLLVRQHRQTVIDCIAEFKKKYPKASFRIFYQEELGENADFDLVISGQAAERNWLLLDCLITEEISAVIPAKHPLAKKSKISFSDLAKEEFAIIYRNSDLWNQTLLHCRLAGFEPKVSVVCGDLYCLMKYIGSGLAVTLGPKVSWREIGSEEVLFLPLEENLMRSTNLYRSKWKNSSLLSEVFCQFITSYFKELA